MGLGTPVGPPIGYPPNGYWPNGYWDRPIIQPGCDHCYCLEISLQDTAMFDWNGNQRTTDHAKCCKCGDLRHKKFIGGLDSGDNT